MIRITPPDGAEWSIEAIGTEAGVNLVIFIPELSALKVTLLLDGGDARRFARAVLAAVGDGAERTFVDRAGLEG